MRKIASLILLMVVCFGYSQQGGRAFESGEYLKYVVKYGPFNTSYGYVKLENKKYAGKEVFHAYGRGFTMGLAKLFFKVDDTYESYFDKNTGRPYFFNRDIYEGGYTKKLNIFFNDEKWEATVKNLENGEVKTISINASVQDVVTALFYFRNKEGMDRLKDGEMVPLDMIFDDDQIFPFRLKYLGKETISTRFGSIEALKFCPMVQDGRVFKAQESLVVWVSNDKNKVPVKIKASLRVGSLIGELTEYKGLKNEGLLK